MRRGKVSAALGSAAFIVTLLLFQAMPMAAHADGTGDAFLSGVVESLPSSGLIGDWMVNGTVVHVTDQTQIDQEEAQVTVGAMVEVQGTANTDGSISAWEISVSENETEGSDDGQIDFTGQVASMPQDGVVGDWVIGDQTVHVTTDTEVDGGDLGIAVGSTVEVQGFVGSDGTVTATQVSLVDCSTSGSDSPVVASTCSGGEDDAVLTGTASTLGSGAAHLGTWKVGARSVRVTSSTRIVKHGHRLAKGAKLRVRGVLRGGTLRASVVTVLHG
jgi:type 1 fimbria pilin